MSVEFNNEIYYKNLSNRNSGKGDSFLIGLAKKLGAPDDDAANKVLLGFAVFCIAASVAIFFIYGF